MAKTTDRDLIRWALLDAVKWEKSLLDSYAGTQGQEETRAKIRARIEAFESLLNRRYGGVPSEPEYRMIDIRDIK